MSFFGYLRIALLCSICVVLPVSAIGTVDAVYHTIGEKFDVKTLQSIYHGEEQMHFSVSWNGGIKIGDLYISIQQLEPEVDRFAINVRVTDYGMFQMVYPVDDTFSTIVEGPLKLPVRYDVYQKEGWGRETKRLTTYDQDELEVVYRKNKQPGERYAIAGRVYNEFSAFFLSRVINFLELQQPIIVPAFVDKKRHEVTVKAVAREKRESIFGEVDTLKIQPKMDFKGLYDKDGDTVFWVTDDACRAPIEINSKIVVGYLSAELEEYSNSRCAPIRR